MLHLHVTCYSSEAIGDCGNGLHSDRKSTSGIENVFVFTDVFIKYTISIPTHDQTAKTVGRFFVREWIKKLGVPERMHSNQSRSFENQIIKQLCLLYQVRKSKMTLYHPCSVGMLRGLLKLQNH